MEAFEYDIHGKKTNSYQSTFFHMKVEDVDLKDMNYEQMTQHDLGVFIHEYIHYIQQITTPYGLSNSLFYIKQFVLFRGYINDNENINLPIKIGEYLGGITDLNDLKFIKGSEGYIKGSIDDVFLTNEDILNAKVNRTAVNIGVFDSELNRKLEKGFDFGYNCVIEGMAHLIQSIINPELFHNKIPYRAVELISEKYYTDISKDKNLLISICYTALYFDNPGVGFFTIMDFSKRNPELNGQQLFKIFMTDFSRKYNGSEMPAYRMMHSIIDDFIRHLQAVIGTELVYYKEVLNNCKLEASSGESQLLDIIYNGDIGNAIHIKQLISFYGIPCIDSSAIEPYIPGEHAFLETATLLSFELLYKRFKEQDGKKSCDRFERCSRFPREEQRTSAECLFNQWDKTEACLFTNGLKYWIWDKKQFE